MIEALVHYEEAGKPTQGAGRPFSRVPIRGEILQTGSGNYEVVKVEWRLDGTPVVAARKII